jgi:Ca2+-transporting ATPase
MTPMQLLWLNLASDPLPALALGLEPPEVDVLEYPPHDPRAPILTPYDFRRLLREGTVIAAPTLAAYFLLGGATGGPRASTVTFHGLTMAQLLHAISSRSESHGIAAEFNRPANPMLYGAIAASAGLQVAAQLIPATRRLLGLTPLGMVDILGIAAVALGSTLANDVIGYLVGDNRAPTSGPQKVS